MPPRSVLMLQTRWNSFKSVSDEKWRGLRHLWISAGERMADGRLCSSPVGENCICRVWDASCLNRMGLGKPSLPSLSVRGGFLGERPEGTSKEIERNFAVLVGVSTEAQPWESLSRLWASGMVLRVSMSNMFHCSKRRRTVVIPPFLTVVLVLKQALSH